MAYELHIVKGIDQEEISLKDWKNLIDKDPELAQDENDLKRCYWEKHPFGGIDGNKPCFRFFEGRISTSSPDEFLTLKMFELAEVLTGVVMDDEAVLNQAYRQELESSCQQIIKNNQKSIRRPWWKFW